MPQLPPARSVPSSEPPPPRAHSATLCAITDRFTLHAPLVVVGDGLERCRHHADACRALRPRAWRTRAEWAAATLTIGNRIDHQLRPYTETTRGFLIDGARQLTVRTWSRDPTRELAAFRLEHAMFDLLEQIQHAHPHDADDLILTLLAPLDRDGLILGVDLLDQEEEISFAYPLLPPSCPHHARLHAQHEAGEFLRWMRELACA